MNSRLKMMKSRAYLLLPGGPNTMLLQTNTKRNYFHIRLLKKS